MNQAVLRGVAVVAALVVMTVAGAFAWISASVGPLDATAAANLSRRIDQDIERYKAEAASPDNGWKEVVTLFPAGNQQADPGFSSLSKQADAIYGDLYEKPSRKVKDDDLRQFVEGFGPYHKVVARAVDARYFEFPMDYAAGYNQ